MHYTVGPVNLVSKHIYYSRRYACLRISFFRVTFKERTTVAVVDGRKMMLNHEW